MNEGFQVGDKAIKVLNSYQAKYPKTTERPLSDGKSIFELGDGYVIEISYEPKKLDDNSVITGINFYHRPDITTTINTSYAREYKTLSALYSDSELIVIGQIEGRIEEGDFDRTVIPYTDFSFSVERIIKGQIEGTKIQIRQTGGPNKTQLVQLKEDPLFKEGDTALLFLKFGTGDKYYVVGGPQGRFPILNGQVSSLNYLEPNSKPYLKIDLPPTELEKFIDLINNGSEIL